MDFFQMDEYSLVPIRMEDRFLIKQWRNEQMDILRQTEYLTDDNQERYFQTVIRPLFDSDQPTQILFSFLKGEMLIGYGGLVHIDWISKTAEISFLLETSRSLATATFQNEFSIYLKLIKVIAFEEIQLFKINTFAFDLRPYLYSPLVANGFREEARIRQANLIGNRRYDTVIHSTFNKDHQRSKREPFNVLVTSISAKTCLLRDVKLAIERADVNGLLFGADIDPNCIGRYFVDRFWQMPSLNIDRIDEIVEYCVGNRIKAIIPTRDKELIFWSRFKAEFADRGVYIMVSDYNAIETITDKLAFYQKGILLGAPVIETAEKAEEIAGDTYVVKERFGAASKNIGLSLTYSEAVEHARKLSQPLFQPYISGIEYSVDLYVNTAGKVAGIICRTRDVVKNGESQVTTTCAVPELEALSIRLAEGLGLYGHVMFQAIENNESGFHFIECNGRYGGASSLSLHAGVDSFSWFLLECRNENVPTGTTTNEKKLRQVRYPANLIVVV